MQCPYCNHQFPLTWRRYFVESGPRHRCPACQRVSRLPRTVSYILLLIAGQSILGIPCAVLLAYNFGAFWSGIGWGIGGLLGGIPIDKMILDEHFRKLEKIEETP